MTAEIIPFGDFQLCPCGAGVARSLTAGGFVCSDCADKLKAEQALLSTASVMLSDPGESTTLDDLLTKLVRP